VSVTTASNSMQL